MLLVDKVGFLLQLYAYGDAAWIGGGFGSAGVHNVLEPAVYGMPCFYGPIYHQFREAIELIEKGGASTVQRAEELCAAITSANMPAMGKAANDYVHSMSGATDLVMDGIARLIK